MEIERKFLISGFPDLPVAESSEMEQGYLCVKPVVRIRKKTVDGRSGYRLCIKGEGPSPGRKSNCRLPRRCTGA